MTSLTEASSLYAERKPTISMPRGVTCLPAASGRNSDTSIIRPDSLSVSKAASPGAGVLLIGTCFLGLNRPLPLVGEGVDVLLPGAEEIQEVHARVFACLADAQED